MRESTDRRHGHRLLIVDDSRLILEMIYDFFTPQGWVVDVAPNARKALGVLPHYVEARVNLALAVETQGKVGEALNHYREALKIWPEYPEAHLGLGVTYIMTGQRQKALEQLGILERIHPAKARELLSLIKPETR